MGSLLQLAPSKIFKLYLLVTMNEVNDRGGDQGQTGRVFQLRVGSGSGIEKIFWVGSGIGYLYQIPSQLGIIGY